MLTKLWFAAICDLIMFYNQDSRELTYEIIYAHRFTSIHFNWLRTQFFLSFPFLNKLKERAGRGWGRSPPSPTCEATPLTRISKFATSIFAVFKVTNLFTLLIPYLPSEFASHIETIFLLCHSIIHLNLIGNWKFKCWNSLLQLF